MSGIVNLQRRPAEHVFGQFNHQVERGEEYSMGLERLRLVGISRGEGTCSDLKGINIAVFELTRPAASGKNVADHFTNYDFCHGAVLIRPCKEEDVSENEDPNSLSCKRVIEGLERVGNQKIVTIVNLKRNGKKAIYTSLVTASI